MDRYNHDLGDDTDDTDDSPLFGSFSSYSPQSRKISQTRQPLFNTSEPELDFSRKQLFRCESEASETQLSPGFVATASSSSSSSVSLKPLPKSSLPEKNQTPPVMKNSSFYEATDKSEKSDANLTTSTASATFSRDIQPPVPKHTAADALSVSLSTPESSQTESDDVSPQIQRKRHSHTRDKLPRFSISIDDEHM